MTTVRHEQIDHNPSGDQSGATPPTTSSPPRTLDRLVAEDGPPPVVRALALLAGLARELDRLHARGVVDGQVRPWRVAVGSEDRVSLLPVTGEAERACGTDAPTTAADARYRSPQVLAGEAPRATDDLYALATIASDLLGYVADRPSAEGATLSPALVAALRAQTGAAPSGRFGSGAQFVRELERAASPDARPDRPKSIAELMSASAVAVPTAHLGGRGGLAHRPRRLSLAEMPDATRLHRPQPLPRRIRRMDYPDLALPGVWVAALVLVLCSVYLLPAFYMIRDALARL